MALLLDCSTIRLDNTNSVDWQTGLHNACYCNNVDCVRLFLEHPACTKQIVTMVDREGLTAEMLANEMDKHDCVRMVRELLGKPDSAGVTDVVPAKLENMTLKQIGDAIERLTAFEPTME